METRIRKKGEVAAAKSRPPALVAVGSRTFLEAVVKKEVAEMVEAARDKKKEEETVEAVDFGYKMCT